MARQINRLSARAVAAQSEKGMYPDGGGLYLQVSGAGAKSWIFRFMLDRKARAMGLGSLNAVSLADARSAAEICRKLVKDGVDPIADRSAARTARKKVAADIRTFRHCAEMYIKAQSKGWKNVKHANQWENTLKAYVYPVFGDMPVNEIDTSLVTDVLEPIWATKTETASRVRGRIESILDWAAARNYRGSENPARWRGHLDKLLPKKSKVQKVVHHPALPYQEMYEFMPQLRSIDALGARGLEFLILTAARTTEVIGAEWSEFDLSNRIWTVPAGRMKADIEHRIPLSPAAIGILNTLKIIARTDFVFPGGKPNSHLSNGAFLALLERMGRGNITSHGFRSTFRDWAAERTAFPNEVAEMALAHTIGDKVEAAYRRGDLLDKRRQLMDAWADYCALTARSKGDNVVSLAGAS